MKKLILLFTLCLVSLVSCTKSDENFSGDNNPINGGDNNGNGNGNGNNNPNAPKITGFTPTSGPIGTVITITGENFTTISENSLTINGIALIVDSATPTSISARIPAQAGLSSGVMNLSNLNGSAKSTAVFEFIPPPTITSFTPSSAEAGVTVTITGTGFTTATPNNLSINGTTIATGSATTTNITFVVPAGISSGLIAISNANGNVSSASNFTFISPPAPTITSMYTNVCAGDYITITGTGFTANSTVFVGGLAIQIVYNSSASISFYAPDAGYSGNSVAVRSEYGSSPGFGPLFITDCSGGGFDDGGRN
jgi:hypothetical protein